MSRLIRSGDLGSALAPERPAEEKPTYGDAAETAIAGCPTCESLRTEMDALRRDLEKRDALILEMKDQLAEKEHALSEIRIQLDEQQSRVFEKDQELSLARALASLTPELPEEDLVRLLGACLDKFASQRAFSDEQVQALVKDVLDHVGPQAKVALSVSTDDVALVRGLIRDELQEQATSYSVSVDESLERGDVLVSTDTGDWDGRLSSRVEALKACLEPG